MHNRTTLLSPGAIFAAALILRLVHLWQYRDCPFFAAPVVDAKTFLDSALLIAGGEFWGGEGPYWQPPLYIYLLALVCWLLPASYFIGIRVLQSTLGAASCVLIYLLARRAFGERVARIAGGVSAVCGSFLYFEGELLAVPLEIVINLLLLYRLSLALDSNRGPDWTIAGIVAGFAALTRPNIVVFIAAFCTWSAWRTHREAGLLPWQRILFFLLPVLLVVLPITWRNWTAEPDLVFISSNGGINFYIGNNSDYENTTSLHPGMRWEQMAMQPVRAGHETAAAKSSFFLRKGLSYIVTNPLESITRLFAKGYYFWSGPEIKRNQNIYYARQYSQLLGLLLWDWYLSFPFGLIGPLSLLGIGLSLSRRDLPVSLLRLYTVCYVASVLLFFPAARYRMPVLPVLIIFAAYGVWRLYRSVREKSWSRTATMAVPMAALLVLLNLTQAAPMAEDAQLSFDLGEVHLRKGDYELAERYSSRALELEPDYNYARHNLAVAYFQQQKYRQAEREALAALNENPLRTDTRILLGRIYLNVQNPRQAETHLQRALQNDPESSAALYYYGRLLYDQRKFAAAVPYLRKAAAGQPDDFWLRYEIGRALQRAGRNNEALIEYEQALLRERRPEALVAIGAMHLLSGREHEAQARFREALVIDPQNPEAHINLALIDMLNGDYDKTIKRLRQMLERHASPQAQKLLAETQRRQRAN